MYRFGPSGIPLSCKGRTLKDGIEDVHSLGLTALEIQLVRLNISERFITDEEVGMLPMQIQDELPVEIVRKEGEKSLSIFNLRTKLKKGDMLKILNTGFVSDYNELAELGRIAKEVDVQLSLHTPYYMDMTGDPEMARRSMDAAKWSALIADQMNSVMVVTHMGMYGTLYPQECLEKMVEKAGELNDWRKRNGITVPFGIETSGRQEIFGTVDEVVALCQRVPGIEPVLNFAHIHARENGSLKKKENFQKIFDKVGPPNRKDFYTHFSGVEYELGNERRYTPIKKGDLKFEFLAECVLENEFSVTFISSSPLLEHDAMYMRVILERVLAKKEAKKKAKLRSVSIVHKPKTAIVAVKKPAQAPKTVPAKASKPKSSHKPQLKLALKLAPGAKAKQQKSAAKKPEPLKTHKPKPTPKTAHATNTKKVHASKHLQKVKPKPKKK